MISISRFYKRLSPTTKILSVVSALMMVLIFVSERESGGAKVLLDAPSFAYIRDLGLNAIKNADFKVTQEDAATINRLEAGKNDVITNNEFHETDTDDNTNFESDEGDTDINLQTTSLTASTDEVDTDINLNTTSLTASTVQADTDNSLQRRLPNAHIMGAMKSGTETLHTFLGVHPDVLQAPVMSLAFLGIVKRGLDWYLEQMPLSRPDQVTMTIQGGWDPAAPQRALMFYKLNKDMKLIMILRDPVRRAISHFSMWQSIHDEWRNKSFEDAIYEPTKPGTINAKVPVIRMGMYYEGLLPYLQYFPMKQILIVDAAAFIKDPLSELIKLETGLGLPHKLTSDLLYFDEKRGFYCYVKQGVNQCMPGGKGRTHVEVKNSTLDALRRFYRPHNEKFFVAFNRTFDWQ